MVKVPFSFKTNEGNKTNSNKNYFQSICTSNACVWEGPATVNDPLLSGEHDCTLPWPCVVPRSMTNCIHLLLGSPTSPANSAINIQITFKNHALITLFLPLFIVWGIYKVFSKIVIGIYYVFFSNSVSYFTFNVV